MKILVPVDFYDTSFSAFKYAAKLREHFGGELVLLHVINGMLATDDTSGINPNIAVEEASEKRLSYFAHDLAEKEGLNLEGVSLKTTTRFGVPGFSIVQYAKSAKVDLIVMGTKDKHGFFDKLLGSNSITVMEDAACPVLLVHQHTEWQVPERVTFAIDDDTDMEKPLEEFIEFNDVFQAQTDFVHVKDEDSDIHDERKQIVQRLFNEREASFPFVVKTIEGNSLKSALLDYCLQHNTDMLVMIYRNIGFLQSVFKRNNTVEIADAIHLPILIYK